MIEMPVHSPLQRVAYTTQQGNHLEIDMKRDDLIHPYISGNKWRKLKYHLREAEVEKKTDLLTFGGPWSNHLLATAFAAAQFNFSSQGQVRGEPVSNPILQMCRLMGMQLNFVSRADYKDKTTLAKKHKQSHTYCIPEGGCSVLGARGCGEILDELGTAYDHIVCACGTGTTLAGLAHAGKKQPGTHFHGIPVLKQGHYLREEILNLYPKLDNFTLHTPYHFGGYGKTNAVLNAFVAHFSAQTGILIEPTYTGKALFGLMDLIQQGYFMHERVLFIHTGGLTGLLGHLNHFPGPAV